MPSLTHKEEFLGARLVFWALVLLYLQVFLSAVGGIDFGYHWDEKATYRQAVSAIAEGRLYNQEFFYGDYLFRCFYLVARFAPASADPYPLVRTLTVFFSSLSVFAAFYMGRQVGLSRLASLAAAAVWGLSFETLYHARWAAPDPGMAFYAACAVGFALAYYSQRRVSLLVLAAAASAFAGSAKYPGFFSLGAALLAALLTPAPWLQRLLRLVMAGAVSLLVFALLNPQVLANWSVVQYEFNMLRTNYGSPELALYRTGSPFASWKLLWEYYFNAGFSPYRPVAEGLMGFAVLGSLVLVKRDWRAFVIVTLPCLTLCHFYLGMGPVIVRSFLAVMPWLAVLSMVGAAWLASKLAWARWGLVAALALGLVLNAGYQWKSALSIRAFSKADPASLALAEVLRQPRRTWVLGPSLSRQVVAKSLAVPANAILTDDANRNDAPADWAKLPDPCKEALPGRLLMGPDFIAVAPKKAACVPAVDLPDDLLLMEYFSGPDETHNPMWQDLPNHYGNYQLPEGTPLDVNHDFYWNWMGRPHCVYRPISREWLKHKMGLS